MIGSLHSRRGDALKGGNDVGSRVRIAAAACLVASGLLAGGASASVAFADPRVTNGDAGDAGDKHTNDSVGNGSVDTQQSDPDKKKTPAGADGKEEEAGNYPRGHKVGGDKPDGQKPDEQKPDGDKPDEQKPEGQLPDETRHDEEPGKGDEDGQTPGDENLPPDDPTEDPCGCDEGNKDDCSPEWPVGQPPGPGGGGGGGGGHPEVPSGRPGVPPPMQLPPELMPPTTGPVGPTVVDVEPGVGIAAAQLPIAPITLPVIVAPATGLGGGGGSPGAPALPVAPRGVTAEPPAGREPLPANVGSNVAVPAASYRIGYTEYLRNAGLSQVAALALPGVAGMLVLTGAGGLVGYRQAKAGHAVHTGVTARFVN
jgi:hypothetical protein